MFQKNVYIAFVISIVMIIFTGCSTFNIPSDYSLNSSTGKGLLVFSFTANDKIDNAVLHYHGKSSSGSGEITFKTFKNPLDWTNPQGRLVTIEESAGTYEIYKWSIPMVGESDAYFSIPFRITPGKVTYIGNVYLEVNEFPSVFQFEIADSSSRDLTLLKQRFINIDLNTISNEISKYNIKK
jgi:hypothetical protein